MKFLFTLLFISLQIALFAQGLPKGLTDQERLDMEWYDFTSTQNLRGETTPPPVPVRTMAEWEEIQGLLVTWTQYRPTLAEIIRYAKEETTVYVITNNVPSTMNSLIGTYGLPDLDNVEFIETGYNSIWMRDYGPNTVYYNDVDSLAAVEWIYNRPRPADDVVPQAVADHIGFTLYSTTAAPDDLVHTGGNFTADGLGTAFSSELVMEENEPGNPYGVTVKSEADIDAIMQNWMGIDRYIKMPTLPYDGIHHIDMHMRLLDEETIMVGEYPAGVADGPQIEANLQYVLSNFNSPFGTPYKVVRIPMPPQNGAYPDTWWADYRTYTNSVIVNKTVLVPTYEEQYDTTALRIYREAMPGYRVIGIDCNNIIQASGALHCITRAVGVDDPLWMVHQEHPDVTTDVASYELTVRAQHRSGVDDVTLFYTMDTTAGFVQTPMWPNGDNTFTATVNATGEPGELFYYIHAIAENGKELTRPLVGAEGPFRFEIGELVSTKEIEKVATLEAVFPNPAAAITCVPLNFSAAASGSLYVTDALGRTVETLFEGRFTPGEQKFFVDAGTYSAGIYFVNLRTEAGSVAQKLVVR